jgi:uncharacterized Zn ribbon protein
MNRCPECNSEDKHINFWDDTKYVCNNCWCCWDSNYEDIKTIRKKKLKKLNSSWLRFKRKISI